MRGRPAQRRRRALGGDDTGLLAEALADVLEETLDDLRAERDPRRAVIAAYARLERTLAAFGLPRRPSATFNGWRTAFRRVTTRCRRGWRNASLEDCPRC